MKLSDDFDDGEFKCRLGLSIQVVLLYSVYVKLIPPKLLWNKIQVHTKSTIGNGFV